MTVDAVTGRRDRRTDLAVAATVALVAVLGVWLETRAFPDAIRPPRLLGYLLAVATSAPLVWRRDRPAVVAVAALAVATLYPALGFPGWAPAVALFVAYYSLAAY